MAGRGNRWARTRGGAIGTVLGLLATALVPLVPLVATQAPAGAVDPVPGAVESVQLSLLGKSDLASMGLDGQTKPRGQNGDVAVLGRTAFVAAGPIFHGAASTTGRICTDHGGVKVVNVTNPATPTVVSTIVMEDTKGVTTRAGAKFNNVSVTASALDAKTVTTATSGFNGDILAIATQRCEPSFFSGARLEFWNVTNPAAPVLFSVFDPADIPFGTSNGQWGIFEDVRMFTRGGKLMAMATTPFSIGNAHDASPFGDFRLIDLSDLSKPKQQGVFPSVTIGQDSVNGCRTFQAGKAAAPTPDGNGAILSWYDGTSELSPTKTAAVFKLDLGNLPQYVAGTTPAQFTPTPPNWGYPPDVDTEGNASDVQPFTDAAGNLQVLLSEDDLDPARTTIGIGATGGTQTSYRGCTILAGKHLYEFPNQQINADLAYVGRSCPASTLAGTTNTVADDFLVNPAGKIAVIEGGGNQNDGCSVAEKLDRLKAAGALASLQNAGGEVLNTQIAGPRGGIPSIPSLTFPQSAYNTVQLVTSPVLGTITGTSTLPTAWERSTTTNLTLQSFPNRADKGRYKSVADATDRVARAQTATASRFNVTAGAAYQAGASLQVEAITGGAFRAAVVWYDAAGTALSESEIASLSAVAARATLDKAVTAPANAVKGAIKIEWTGGAAAAGTAYGDSFSMVKTGLNSTIKDNQGQWGAQRVLNFSATPPTEVGTYRSPKSLIWPPPDNGLYAPRQARMFGRDIAFTSWMSDGLRVLDVSKPDAPREMGSYVPPTVADPTPQAGAGAGLTRGPVWGDRTLVTGVDVIPTGDSSGLVLVSDVNAGLYVLGFQLQRKGELPPGGTTNAGPGEQVRVVGAGFVPGATVQLTAGGVNLSTATADASGSLATGVTLPVGLAASTVKLEAVGPAPGGREQRLAYNLVDPAGGYWTVASDGGVFSFGTAKFFGSVGGVKLNSKVVGLTPTPSGNGYWLVAGDGGIFSFGDARFFGSTGATPLNKPIVGMTATPSGNGYWLVASDGGIFAFGDAGFFGSTGALRLDKPVVGMAASASGGGYLLTASDGGIFAFGDAVFRGSTGGTRLDSPVVGIAAPPSGSGYWLVAADGGVFAFGVPFYGSVGGTALRSPAVGIGSTPAGRGYWLTAADGGIFSFGTAAFAGSTGGITLSAPVVGLSGLRRTS